MTVLYFFKLQKCSMKLFSEKVIFVVLDRIEVMLEKWFSLNLFYSINFGLKIFIELKS